MLSVRSTSSRTTKLASDNYFTVTGDSGSWVVYDRRLCGMVIAGRSDSAPTPCAYMLMIEDIFESISKFFGGAKIRLPTISELGLQDSRNDCDSTERLFEDGVYAYPRLTDCNVLDSSQGFYTQGDHSNEESMDFLNEKADTLLDIGSATDMRIGLESYGSEGDSLDTLSSSHTSWSGSSTSQTSSATKVLAPGREEHTTSELKWTQESPRLTSTLDRNLSLQPDHSRPPHGEAWSNHMGDPRDPLVTRSDSIGGLGDFLLTPPMSNVGRLSDRKYANSLNQVPRLGFNCPYCDDSKRFRGKAELDRHIYNRHGVEGSVFICVDPFANGNSLSDCRFCREGKRYNMEHNAAAHLRRKHFHPNLARKGIRLSEGNLPPLEVVRSFIRRVNTTSTGNFEDDKSDMGDRTSFGGASNLERPTTSPPSMPGFTSVPSQTWDFNSLLGTPSLTPDGGSIITPPISMFEPSESRGSNSNLNHRSPFPLMDQLSSAASPGDVPISQRDTSKVSDDPLFTPDFSNNRLNTSQAFDESSLAMEFPNNPLVPPDTYPSSTALSPQIRPPAQGGLLTPAPTGSPHPCHPCHPDLD